MQSHEPDTYPPSQPILKHESCRRHVSFAVDKQYAIKAKVKAYHHETSIAATRSYRARPNRIQAPLCSTWFCRRYPPVTWSTWSSNKHFTSTAAVS